MACYSIWFAFSSNPCLVSSISIKLAGIAYGIYRVRIIFARIIADFIGSADHKNKKNPETWNNRSIYKIRRNRRIGYYLPLHIVDCHGFKIRSVTGTRHILWRIVRGYNQLCVEQVFNFS